MKKKDKMKNTFYEHLFASEFNNLNRTDNS